MASIGPSASFGAPHGPPARFALRLRRRWGRFCRVGGGCGGPGAGLPTRRCPGRAGGGPVRRRRRQFLDADLPEFALAAHPGQHCRVTGGCGAEFGVVDQSAVEVDHGGVMGRGVGVNSSDNGSFAGHVGGSSRVGPGAVRRGGQTSGGPPESTLLSGHTLSRRSPISLVVGRRPRARQVRFERHTIGQENSGSQPQAPASRNHHHWKILSPAAKRHFAVDMLQGRQGHLQNGLACKSSRARPLHLPTRPAGGEPKGRSGRRSAGLAARLRQAHPVMGFVGPGRRCAATSTAGSTEGAAAWPRRPAAPRAQPAPNAPGRLAPQVCADTPKGGLGAGL